MEPDELQIPQRLPVAERINAGLIRESAEALAKLRDRTGLSKTDAVNRAITVYEFIDAEIRKGNDIIVRDLEGRDQLVKLFP
jgi:hypothetical protein